MKLVVCDFDNTLKVHIKSLDKKYLWRTLAYYYASEQNYDELKAAKKRGNVIALVTGRDLHNLKKALGKDHVTIDMFDYICCTEGTAIYDRNEKVLDTICFEDDLLRLLEPYNHVDGILVKTSRIQDHISRIIYHIESVDLHRKVLDDVIRNVDCEVIYDSQDIQFLPKGINKCWAVDKLVKKLGVKEDDVYCFGDGQNDIVLFEKYKGYAMRWSDASLLEISFGIYDSVAAGIRAISSVQSMFSESAYFFELDDEDFAYVDSLIQRYENLCNCIIDEQRIIEEKLDEQFDVDADMKNYASFSTKVKSIITGMVNDFHFFDGYEVDVVLTGSFSRNTAKTFSDIDISLFYEDKYYNCLRKYEELFYYTIMKVFHLPRRFVHSVLLANSIRFDEEDLQRKDIACNIDKTVIFRNYKGLIYDSYRVEADTVDVITRIDRTSRSFGKLREYLLFLIAKNEWREWFINFTLIKGNRERWKRLKCEMIDWCKDSQVIIAQKLEDQRLHKLEKYEHLDIHLVCDYKYFYQMEMFMYLYDIKSFLEISRQMDVQLQKSIYEYLWLVRKVARSLKKEGYIYSSHITNQQISVNDIRIVETKRKAISIIRMIGECNGLSNNTNEK